jgi:hypothetical protein
MLTRLAVPVLALLALPAGAAAAPIAPASVVLGDAFIGGSGPVVFVPVTTDGGGASAITASVDDTANFVVDTNFCSGLALTAPPDACSIGVRFTPQTAGPHAATLTIAATQGTDTVALTGTGVERGTGPRGEPGPAGPGGAPGPAGPQGVPGRAIQATCTTKGRPRRTSCRIVILPDDVAATSIRVRLVRAGKTVARGGARREGAVRLKARRRVRPGRYTVAVSFVVDGRRVSGRQVVRVR